MADFRAKQVKKHVFCHRFYTPRCTHFCGGICACLKGLSWSNYFGKHVRFSCDDGYVNVAGPEIVEYDCYANEGSWNRDRFHASIVCGRIEDLKVPESVIGDLRSNGFYFQGIPLHHVTEKNKILNFWENTLKWNFHMIAGSYFHEEQKIGRAAHCLGIMFDPTDDKVFTHGFGEWDMECKNPGGVHDRETTWDFGETSYCKVGTVNYEKAIDILEKCVINNRFRGAFTSINECYLKNESALKSFYAYIDEILSKQIDTVKFESNMNLLRSCFVKCSADSMNSGFLLSHVSDTCTNESCDAVDNCTCIKKSEEIPKKIHEDIAEDSTKFQYFDFFDDKYNRIIEKKDVEFAHGGRSYFKKENLVERLKGLTVPGVDFVEPRDYVHNEINFSSDFCSIKGVVWMLGYFQELREHGLDKFCQVESLQDFIAELKEKYKQKCHRPLQAYTTFSDRRPIQLIKFEENLY